MSNKVNVKLKIRMILIFLIVVFLGAAIGMLFTPIFDVQEAWCEGNDRIPQEDIIEASQIVFGKNIILQNVSGIRKKVESMPMVESATVKRVIPNKFKIIITERVPAAYMSFGDELAVVDTEGRVLDILADERVGIITEKYTPEAVKKKENQRETGGSAGGNADNPNRENQEENDGESTIGDEASGDEGDSDQTTDDINSEEAGGEQMLEMRETAENSLYAAPLLKGVELDRAEAGKKTESREKEKFNIALELLSNLEKAGLLSRATYIDLNDISNVMLVIENRLEIQLGNTENLEYRCNFLAKVINEKISSTEHVVMDYRTDDIYVRQPDDGKARVQATAAPEALQEEDDGEDSSSDGSKSNLDSDD